MTRRREAHTAGRPAKCPHCGDRDVVTTSKLVDANTHWRCQACGGLWNIDRRGSASRFGFRR
jgi:transposase-like protein